MTEPPASVVTTTEVSTEVTTEVTTEVERKKNSVNSVVLGNIVKIFSPDIVEMIIGVPLIK